MNNFQVFVNHRILDSNLEYCLYVTDDHIPVNDTVIRISCQSSRLTPAGYCQSGIIVHTIRLLTVQYYHLLVLNNRHIHGKCQCTTMSSEIIISSPNIAINNVRSTCEEDVLSIYVSSASKNVSIINSNNSSINSIYFIGVLISSKIVTHISTEELPTN